VTNESLVIESPEDDGEILGWVKILTDDQLEATKQHYYDLWTWESGDPSHRFLYEVLEHEKERRTTQHRNLNEHLNRMLEFIESGDLSHIDFNVLDMDEDIRGIATKRYSKRTRKCQVSSSRKTSEN